jgi:hypothetical protein
MEGLHLLFAARFLPGYRPGSSGTARIELLDRNIRSPIAEAQLRNLLCN